MAAENTAEYLRVRRAYELGRARTALRRTLYVVVPIALVASLVTGRAAVVWLPVTFAVWLVLHWRGGPLLRGGLIGLVGGAITYALPMTILRPCCSPEAMAAGMECCTNPGACLSTGVLLGITLAAFVPLGEARWRTAAGVMAGVASVALLRCSTLFAAEALGLVGGLVGGIMIATVGRAFLGMKPASSR